MDSNITVVLILQNNENILFDCIEWLTSVYGIKNIILVDNGSKDGTVGKMSCLEFDNIIFDEGIQGYSTIVNAVVDNFELSDIVVFMDIRFILAANSLLWIKNAFEEPETAIAGFSIRDNFSSLDEMLASEIKYDGYCKQELRRTLGVDSGIWAISKETLLRYGKFNENLYTSKSCLMDYELRLIEQGNIPVVACNAYVYEINMPQREENVLQHNINSDRCKMKEKWNMNYFNLQPHYSLLNLMNDNKDADLEVLEVGCDMGASLIEVTNRFYNANIHGLEINKDAVFISKNIIDIVQGNVENKDLKFKQKFDYIIFGDVLEHLHDPLGTIKYCRTLLKNNGAILASIPNLMHMSVMKQLLLNGVFEYEDTGLLDRTHIHFFTYYEIIKMFNEAGFIIDKIEGTRTILSQEDKELEDKLLELSLETESFMYEVYQYLIRAVKKD